LVDRFGEVLADADSGPFSAPALVGGEGHDLSILFGRESCRTKWAPRRCCGCLCPGRGWISR
jgi:hypothetical protein